MVDRPDPARADDPRTAGPSAFRRVLCGIDGSPSSLEAVRQAAVLASPAGELDLVCVREALGAGRSSQASISEWRAEAALVEASHLARDYCAGSSQEIISGTRRAQALIERMSDHDLVAVGPHLRSRVGGILVGSTASALLHESPIPVLAARGSLEAEWTPGTLIVASDGSPCAGDAVDIAARIAAAHRSRVILVSVRQGHSDADLRDELARQATLLGEACGEEIVTLRPDGKPEDELPKAAENHHATLLVLGSRGLSGVKALGSVSERVAHRANCSVLIARAAPR